jgi:hypothetical protein
MYRKCDQLSFQIWQSSHQHHIPIFSGTRTEDPKKFLRTFERVAKALKWDNTMKMDKFPNYFFDSAEEFYYINVDCGSDSDDGESGPDIIVKS